MRTVRRTTHAWITLIFYLVVMSAAALPHQHAITDAHGPATLATPAPSTLDITHQCAICQLHAALATATVQTAATFSAPDSICEPVMESVALCLLSRHLLPSRAPPMRTLRASLATM